MSGLEKSCGRSGGDFGNNNAPTIVQILELGTKQIREQLDNIKDSRNIGKHSDGDVVLALEYHE